MRVYTVHEPPLRGDETAIRKDDVVFVRDGFHFWAFLLGPIWMVWHGLWLVLVLYIASTTLLHVALRFAGGGGAHFWLSLLIAFLVGLEAASLRRWTLRRRGYRQVAVVMGDDAESAEHRFFSHRVERPSDAISTRVTPPPTPQMPFEPPSDIVGHFPHYGSRR